MKTQVATSSSSGDAKTAAQACSAEVREKLGSTSPKMVFVFASTKQPLDVLLPAIQAEFKQAVVLGSSTSGEFTESSEGKGECVLIAIAGDLAVEAGIGRDLSVNVETAVQNAVAGMPQAPASGYKHRTAVVLVDPLSGFGEEAALLTEFMLGGDIPLVGGAAGDDLQMNCATVGVGSETATDAIVVAHISTHHPLAIAVRHDHRPVSGPLKVTKAEGARLIEVEGRPAWDVWRDETRAHAKGEGIDVDNLTPEEEGGFLLRFEAGLAVGDGWKVRAPLSRDAEGALSLATSIPEGATIHITESTPQRQIDSARAAAKSARAQLGDRACAGAVVFDCICRNLILGGRFVEAIDAIGEELGGVPLGGLETYGEIALQTEDLSGFHNTTTVLLAFPE